jgi:hypothetical protein
MLLTQNNIILKLQSLAQKNKEKREWTVNQD